MFKIARPSKVLEPYIKQYWSIDSTLAEGEQYLQRLIPSGLPELIMYFGARPKLINTHKTLEDNLLLTGHQKEYTDLQISKSLSVFSIAFQAQGLMNFFNLPLIEIYNQNIPLKYINKKLQQELEPRMKDCNSFHERVEIVELYFTKLLADNKNSIEFQRINRLVNIIRRTRGKVSIDYLASELCLSRKQFERKFSEFIGVSPKQYLKTIRLQLALHLKNNDNGLSITGLAYESGYYDQSHFTNEFKSMTGLRPKQYFDNNDSYSDFFSE